MRIAMVGPFGMSVKSTMRERALPMAKALVKRGHTVSIVVPPWDSPVDAGASYIDEGVEVINSSLPRGKGTLFHLKLTATLVRLVRQIRPDVIHFFKPKAYAGLAHTAFLILRYLRQHNARLIVDEDDWEQAWNDVGDYSSAQKRLFAWQESWGLTHADTVTVASKTLETLVASCGVPTNKIFYVPNGIRLISSRLDLRKALPVWQAGLSEAVGAPEPVIETRTSPLIMDTVTDQLIMADYGGKVRAEYDLLGKPVILLYTRFFEFQLSFLVDVIQSVSQMMPEARWLVVGEGYFGEETRLNTMAESRGIASKLVFAGWVPLETLPNYFTAANVAIYPYDDTTLNRTKCSVKLLDLLTAGVPVVASRVGQNMAYINHGQTGLLVPPQNVDAMVEALLHLLNDRNLQQTIGQAASRYVSRVFHWDRLVDGVEAAYGNA